MNQTPPTTLWNRNFSLLLLNSALINLSFQIITPILPQYCVNLGFTLAHAGMLTGLFAFAALVLRPFCGAFADHFNMKWLTILGSFIMAIGHFVLVIPTGNLGMLMLPRIIQGSGFALNGTACGALATRYMPQDKLGQGIGYFSLASLLAAAFGAPLGLLVRDTFGFSAVFVLAALFAATAVIIILPVSYINAPETVTHRKSFSLQDFFLPSLAPLMFFSGIFSMMTAMNSSFLAVSAEEKGITGFSAFFIIQSVMMLLTRPTAGRMTDQKGGFAVIIPGYLFTAATMLLLALAPNRWIIFIAAVTAALGMGIGSPACQTECVKKVGPERRGAAVSGYYMGCDVANTIGPMLGGAVAGQFGCTTMYLGSAALAVTTLVLYLAYRRHESRL